MSSCPVLPALYFKVREGVEVGHIEPRYINTKLNPSDLFTKDVSREVIEALARMFSGAIPWPDMPTSETALTAQLCDLLAMIEEREW